MGHAHINTTLIYSHYVPAADEADKLSAAFRSDAALVTPLRAGREPIGTR